MWVDELFAMFSMLFYCTILGWHFSTNLFVFRQRDTNLSIVIATMFHADATKSAQRKNPVFHKRHSSSPRIPLLWTLLVFLRIKLDTSKMTEAMKSMILWNNKTNTTKKKWLHGKWRNDGKNIENLVWDLIADFSWQRLYFALAMKTVYKRWSRPEQRDGTLGAV